MNLCRFFCDASANIGYLHSWGCVNFYLPVSCVHFCVCLKYIKLQGFKEFYFGKSLYSNICGLMKTHKLALAALTVVCKPISTEINRLVNW